MKTIIICCNYNESRTGNLAKCIASVAKNKLPDTYFAIADNGSKDGSVEFLKERYQSDAIDMLMVSPKNLGKPRSLNMLLRNVQRILPIAEDDLIMSLDSDIELGGDGEFFSHIQGLCKTWWGYFCAVTVKFTGNNPHLCKWGNIPTVDYNGDKVYVHPECGGVGGAALVVPAVLWKAVSGYRENLGAAGKHAIYGADDATLLSDLWMVTSGLPTFVSSKLTSHHPENEDREYMEWKQSAWKTLPGTDKPFIPEKGFYD